MSALTNRFVKSLITLGTVLILATPVLTYADEVQTGADIPVSKMIRMVSSNGSYSSSDSNRYTGSAPDRWFNAGASVTTVSEASYDLRDVDTIIYSCSASATNYGSVSNYFTPASTACYFTLTDPNTGDNIRISAAIGNNQSIDITSYKETHDLSNRKITMYVGATSSSVHGVDRSVSASATSTPYLEVAGLALEMPRIKGLTGLTSHYGYIKRIQSGWIAPDPVMFLYHLNCLYLKSAWMHE